MLSNNTLTYISLFSSAGVGCYGFKESGFECIATNEIIQRRLEIQKINKKCKFESGYIYGDIKKIDTKNLILTEIERYKKLGNDRVDVIIATPPCQGMSVANHKKNNELHRNSLVVESVEIIKEIYPRFFILENVSSFYKTGCIDKNNNLLTIGDMIESTLSDKYSIYNDVINFKNYGANSSRTRTLVIGVCKELSNFISPIELFPNYQKEKSLKDIISHLKTLKWGEYDENDFYHSFRTYSKHMRDWISDLKEGECAFDNINDLRKPHRVVDGKIVINKRKNGDKYTRQIWNKVAPCIHTRNDQLASQNTIHPAQDRVFSIRELMLMMNIPSSFKWIDIDFDKLNKLTYNEKIKISKKNEMNIRQCIGEAVPTIIFRQIADNISSFMNKKNLNKKEIIDITKKFKLQDIENLKCFIKKNKNIFSISTLSHIAEISNTKRNENSAYFTNKFIINEIAKTLPNFNEDEITIIEPSSGCGNFVPMLFKKYDYVKKVNLKLIDIDVNMLEILKILYKDVAPKNFKLEFIQSDFMSYESKANLIIGNPPFTKLKKENILKFDKSYSSELTNLAGFFLEKSLNEAEYVSMIMPKNLLNTKEYKSTRDILEKRGIGGIIDFGDLGFNGILVETINITTNKSPKVFIKSLPLNISLYQNSKYIFNKKLPYWVIYRNNFFDEIFNSMEFNIFNSFRDRQITNINLENNKKNKNYIRVVKSRNITDDGEIIDIDGYDRYIDKNTLSKFQIYEFLDKNGVYLTPNMTYNPRVIKKPSNCVVNGSVAILIPKKDLVLNRQQMKYFSSNEFRNFYKIARNYQTRSLNIDKTSVYWFGKVLPI